MDLLIATTNAGKVREFGELLTDLPWNCIALSDLPPIPPVQETGRTFRANAVLKASGYAVASGRWTLADDSGLEVDALGSSPGVFSARWAAMHDAGFGDAANNALLLRQLADVEPSRRTARFVCVLALADPAGRVFFTVRDTVEGAVRTSAVGQGGFGYDPLFAVAGMTVSAAELSPAEKHAISHRGKAARRLRDLLLRFDPAR